MVASKQLSNTEVCSKRNANFSLSTWSNPFEIYNREAQPTPQYAT